MALRGIEQGLERLVEGTFARVFRSGVRPVEIGRRVVRVLDRERSVDVKGRTVVPNELTVQLSPVDLDRLADIRANVERELAETARGHARQRSYAFLGPLTVRLTEAPRYKAGRFEVTGRMKEGPGGTGAGSLVVGQQRVALGERPVTIGRVDECEIVTDDPQASRRHAEIRPDGDGYLLTDLGSTNGTQVNGAPVHQYRLVDGDVVMIGAQRFVFEAS